MRCDPPASDLAAPAEADLAAAVKVCDSDGVEQALATWPRPVPDEVLRAAAELHLQQRQWERAARRMGQLTLRDAAWTMRLRMARNLACLQQHRPGVYERLMSVPGGGAYQVATTARGALTVMHKAGGVLLSTAEDPQAAADAQLANLRPALQRDEPVGVCGLGDGYLLAALARFDPGLPFNQRLPVYFLEPETDVLLSCFMIHDYTGPAGPIEQSRFQWFIGKDYHHQYRRAIQEDLYLPPLKTMVTGGLYGSGIHARVREQLQHLAQYHAQLQRQADACYANVSREELASVFGPTPPRPPCILLTTTRFTHVLQHSTRQVAAAFEQLGCAVRLSIEPTDYHRSTRSAFSRHVVEFRPDLVFIIDHLRHEYGPVFPKNLPYVCWIQDNLDHLTRASAGRSVGLRDFILTCSPGFYEHAFDYPRRQSVFMTKLTSPPQASPGHCSTPRPANVPDIVYVSNASQQPAALIDAMLADTASNEPVHRLLDDLLGRLTGVYDRGQAIFTLGDLRRLLHEAEQATAVRLESPAMRDDMVRRLFHPLNNALYRQQALQWAAEAAENLGLTLGIYGHGWEQHRAFSRFARGPVAYGPELEALTAAAPVSLHVVPYLYLHQRLLDGLVADGFFLIREHPSDRLRHEWARFIDTHLDASIRTLDAARQALTGDLRRQLDDMVTLARDVNLQDGIDPIATYRRFEQDGDLHNYEPLPRRAEVSFTDAASLREKLQRFLADTPRRKRIADEQRAFVAARYTYRAGMARVLERVGRLIADEPHAATLDQPAAVVTEARSERAA